MTFIFIYAKDHPTRRTISTEHLMHLANVLLLTFSTIKLFEMVYLPPTASLF